MMFYTKKPGSLPYSACHSILCHHYLYPSKWSHLLLLFVEKSVPLEYYLASGKMKESSYDNNL